MAPGQVPHHTRPWQDAHTLYLLSPLVGFLSRAWSLLRGPGPLQSCLLEAATGAAEVEAGVEGNSIAPEEGGKAVREPSLDLRTSASALEAWGLCCSDEVQYSEEEADSCPPREFTQGQPAPLSPGLPSALQGPDKEREAAEEKREAKSSYHSSHSKGGAAREKEEDGETVNKEATAFSLAPGLESSTWLCCPGKEKEQATDDKGTENKEVGETHISPLRSGFCSRAWQSCTGGVAEEKGSKAREAAEKEVYPKPQTSVPTQGLLLRPWENQPRENTEKEEEDETWDSSLAEDSSVPTANAFLRAWVYRPGEDTEEEEEEEEEEPEDEERDSGSAEEKETEASYSTPSTSPFLRAWEYRPGEDEEEEKQEEEEDEHSDSESAEEGEANASSTSPFLRAWVYQPGEDTEEEEEEEEDEHSDSGSAEEGEATASLTSPFLRAWVYRPGEDAEEEEKEEEEDEHSDSGSAEEGEANASSTSPFLKAWVYRPGKDTEEEEEENQDTDDELGADQDWDTPRGTTLRAWTVPSGGRTREGQAAKARAGAEPRPLTVAIYLPGQRPPAPWAAPKLPLRLQRRLRLLKNLIQDRDPETSIKDRKVHFSAKVTIHRLAVWAGPAQAARRGPWEQLARDRSRFARRIARAQEELGPYLTPAARARALARLGNPPESLDPTPAPPQTPPPAPVPAQAPPMIQSLAALCSSPAQLSGRRG